MATSRTAPALDDEPLCDADRAGIDRALAEPGITPSADEVAALLGERTSDRVIAAILGHTPGTVTARYAKVTLAQMREALSELYRELTEAD